MMYHPIFVVMAENKFNLLFMCSYPQALHPLKRPCSPPRRAQYLGVSLTITCSSSSKSVPLLLPLSLSYRSFFPSQYLLLHVPLLCSPAPSLFSLSFPLFAHPLSSFASQFPLSPHPFSLVFSSSLFLSLLSPPLCLPRSSSLLLFSLFLHFSSNYLNYFFSFFLFGLNKSNFMISIVTTNHIVILISFANLFSAVVYLA